MIVFDFNDPTDVLYYAQSVVLKAHAATVVGPQTYRRVEMQLRGALNTFVIGFQPDGIYRLFSVPTHDLTDHDFDAQAVLGRVIARLGERLGNAVSFSERVQIVDQALLPRALRSTGLDEVSSAAHTILRAGGRARVPELAASARLGVRQFERRFLHQVGMRPKLFAREWLDLRQLSSTKRASLRDRGPMSLKPSATTTRCTWFTTSRSLPAQRPRRPCISWKPSMWSRSSRCERGERPQRRIKSYGSSSRAFPRA